MCSLCVSETVGPVTDLVVLATRGCGHPDRLALRRTWARRLVIGAPYPFGDWIGPSAPDSPVALTVARDATGWLGEGGGAGRVAGGVAECVSVPPAFVASDVEEGGG